MSFCARSKPAALQKWVDSLLATQINQTSVQLYKAIPEIARLKTDYHTRIELLEIVRTTVQDSISGLQKSFLNQPLIMPAGAQKTALIAQTLQKTMVDGYVAAVIQISTFGKAKKQTMNQLALALHRAISGIGLLFFRCHQIYSQTPASLWSTLHILYQVAEYYDLADQSIIDTGLKTTRSSSIQSAYIRVLMLDTARTNQLSQNDIDAAYTVFEHWSTAIKIHGSLTDNVENFFAVNLLGAQGPVYKSKIESKNVQRIIELDFLLLLSQLSKQSGASDEELSSGNAIKVPRDFPAALLTHLLETWGNIAQRKLNRREVSSEADVCIGLVDCHYFACNGQDFDYFLSSSGSPESSRTGSFSQGLTPASHLNASYTNFGRPTFRVSLQNTSAGGYCILWKGTISGKVMAGELIGVKELGKRTWSFGVVRWVRQLKNASQLGIQILTTNAKPYAIAQTYDVGGYSEFMRALFIPPAKNCFAYPTILTSAAPLKEFDKVHLLDGERKRMAKLDRASFQTKAVQQFKFHSLESTVDDASNTHKNTSQNNKSKDEFNSSWD